VAGGPAWNARSTRGSRDTRESIAGPWQRSQVGEAVGGEAQATVPHPPRGGAGAQSRVPVRDHRQGSLDNEPKLEFRRPLGVDGVRIGVERARPG
jgi:hypothetical protein